MKELVLGVEEFEKGHRGLRVSDVGKSAGVVVLDGGYVIFDKNQRRDIEFGLFFMEKFDSRYVFKADFVSQRVG